MKSACVILTCTLPDDVADALMSKQHENAELLELLAKCPTTSDEHAQIFAFQCMEAPDEQIRALARANSVTEQEVRARFIRNLVQNVTTEFIIKLTQAQQLAYAESSKENPVN